MGETLWDKTGQFLLTLKKHSPHTVVAIEKAQEQPLDYGKALLEVESAAKANAEVNLAVQELAAAAKAETNPKIVEVLNENWQGINIKGGNNEIKDNTFNFGK